MQDTLTDALSDGERRCLAALRRVTADGWPATVREVMVEQGHASPTYTFECLGVLEQMGLVKRNPRRPGTGGFLPVDDGAA